MVESLKLFGNVWKDYLARKSILESDSRNRKAVKLLGDLKAAGADKSLSDVVALSAKALKSQADDEQQPLSAEDAEKKRKLEELDQTFQQIGKSWKTDKKAELQRRVTQAKEQLRVLRMMAQQAAASGNKTLAKSLARQITEIARGIAQAAKEAGQNGASPAESGHGGTTAATASPAPTITVSGPVETAAADGGATVTVTLQEAETGSGEVQRPTDAASTGTTAADGADAETRIDETGLARNEAADLKNLMQDARNVIEEAKRLLKSLATTATRERERQDYRQFDDQIRKMLGGIPAVGAAPVAAQTPTPFPAGTDSGFSIQTTTESGITITVAEIPVPGSGTVNLTA